MRDRTRVAPARPWVLLAVLAFSWHPGARAGELIVAVAANFAEAAGELEGRFEDGSRHRVRLASGSTGKLYAQITHGAPFQVLLAADQVRPRRLLDEGLAVPGSRFTYAVGRLVLWSADPARVTRPGPRVLAGQDFRALAMANPALAPYGAAARQTLASLGLLEALSDRIVLGENVGQAFGLVATGNAELGFVALSYVLSPRNTRAGSRWEVPAALHEPIRQDAVLLRAGQRSPAARDFLAFLRSEPARALIRSFGYRAE